MAISRNVIRVKYMLAVCVAAISLVAAGGCACLSPAAAQSYPNRPVKLVLPFAAGGVADITARLAADKLGEKLGQRFVIENQPGPGGISAGRSVLTSSPDGYTLGLVTNGTSISVALYRSLPFDPVKEFSTISILGYFDLVFGTSGDGPYRTLQEFIAAARQQPGKLNIGTVAIGSSQHLGAELFKSAAGIDVQIVTYRTTPDVVVGLLRNDIQLMVDFYAAMKGGLLDGKIRGVGTSGTVRTDYLPEAPPVNEAGVPGYEVTSWNGLFAPTGTPPEVINALNKALQEILANPEVKARYRELGVLAKSSSPEELRSRLQGDVGKWSAVIEMAGIPKQ
jgi:tripartite-type tricarboxylate transporter receptor subunit TctC